MNENTWGFQFVRINDAADGFDTLLALNIGDEHKTRELFEEISNEFEAVKGGPGSPNYIIDLLDEEESIIDDISVTKEEAIKIAAKLGHKLAV
ncbi:hypothetical protein [Bacillus mesophilum]|uniref:Uncharacterized protein n=1 Tax=Bacillus mesophilum TaxID=1071718 RepID=A0A7V7RNI4_9BACI|nr:hypothetical protein [Bacillus mesophilum]KAB2333988.1 hypothetical protein F7732_07865 [Bacillus mesophilum]